MLPRTCALITALALAAPLSAQSRDAAVASAVDRIADAMIQVRHDIHEHPELSNREFRTSELVADHLRELGMEVHTGIAHTGVAAVLRGGRPGPVVAVRADMDALPVHEASGLPFASTAKGEYRGDEVWVSHACGHDIHTTVELGVATVLAGMKDELPGTVLFIFQPAEEGAPPGERGGAELMLEEGVFDIVRPEVVFGLHTAGQVNLGTVEYTPGPAYAAADRWYVTLTGRQAHGARPDLAVDPTVMAAEAVLALQTIRSRNMDPMEPGVVSVGIMKGGERNNIIPMEMYLEGTARTYTEENRELVQRRMGEILHGVAATHGGTADYHYELGVPVTVNDPDLTRRMVPSIARVLGPENVREKKPMTGAEDFSYFANEVPGFYFNLGSQDPDHPSGGHHTPTFRADDAAVPLGIRVMTAVILDYMRGA